MCKFIVDRSLNRAQLFPELFVVHPSTGGLCSRWVLLNHLYCLHLLLRDCIHCCSPTCTCDDGDDTSALLRSILKKKIIIDDVDADEHNLR